MSLGRGSFHRIYRWRGQGRTPPPTTPPEIPSLRITFHLPSSLKPSNRKCASIMVQIRAPANAEMFLARRQSSTSHTALSKQTCTYVYFLKAPCWGRPAQLCSLTMLAAALPWVCSSKLCGIWDKGEEWRGGPFGGGDAGLSYPADICRPLGHKARKISLLSANNPKWKPGALENLRLPRFIGSVLMARERSQGPPWCALGALKLRKAHKDLKINTFPDEPKKEEWVKE